MAALIKDAKQRARRRRLITGGGAAVLVTMAVTGLVILPGSPSPPQRAARNLSAPSRPRPVGSPLDNGNKKRTQEMMRRCNSAVTVRVPDGGSGGAAVPFPPQIVAVPAEGTGGVAKFIPRETVEGQEPQPLTIRWADPPNGVARICYRVQ